MLVSFILLGRTLEQQARYRAADALHALIALQPTVARLVPNSERSDAVQVGVEIPLDRVQVGEWLQVLPGERIPADGSVVLGQTTIDESMLTGESMPILKQLGDPVFAGSLNQSGTIALQVASIGQNTVLAHLIDLVENGSKLEKAPNPAVCRYRLGLFRLWGVRDRHPHFPVLVFHRHSSLARGPKPCHGYNHGHGVRDVYAKPSD